MSFTSRTSLLNRWLSFLCVTLGIGMLAGLAAVNLMPNPPSSGLQFALLYLGIGLTTWGTAGGWPEIRVLLAEARRHLSRNDLLSLAGVLAIALAARLWMLGDSVRVLVDELIPINEMLRLWDTPNLPILQPIPPYSTFPRLFASWQAEAASLFGHNLLALRLPSALVGTATVAVLYGLGRVLFNNRTALVAALLLATFPPHVQFSRIGAVNIADDLFGTAAVLFFAWGIKSNYRAAWALGGTALGLTQYFHEGGRLLFPILIVAWLSLRLLRRPACLRQWRRGLLAAGITFVAIAAPVYYVIGQLNQPATARMNQNVLDGGTWAAILTSRPGSGLFDWLVRHSIDPFLLFVSRPDTSPFYGGSQPLILLILLPAFFAGLLWAFWSSGGRLLLLWFGLTWAGNLVLADSALVSRYVVVFPAVALLLALGITETVSRLRWKHVHKLAAAYVLVCAAVQFGYYFGPHLTQFNQLIRPDKRDAYDAILRAASLPPGTDIYLVQPPNTMTEPYAQTFLRYLNPDLQIHFVNEVQSLNWSELQGRRLAFFVLLGDSSAVNGLSTHFHLPPPQRPPFPVLGGSYDLYLLDG
jgi:4-amino-4-deoxy-L-arabinose transferase-like glycosyltransferase